MLRIILAQTDGPPPPEFEFGDEFTPELLPFPWLLWSWLSGVIGPLLFILTIWMLIYAVRNDPERYLWVWIMILIPGIGAIAYFLIRYLPSVDKDSLPLAGTLKRRRKIRQLETAAMQIGNAYQYVQLGEELREARQSKQALAAYRKALEKEPDNLAALWGAALLEFEQGEVTAAEEKTSKILERDRTYKFGDVSLLYGKCLYARDELTAAREHLEQHIRKWRQPEGLYLLGKICLEQNDPEAARSALNGLIVDLDSSPRAIARKHLFWRSRAKRLLRRVPHSSPSSTDKAEIS